MINDALGDVLLVAAMLCIAWLLIALVRYKKRKGGNTALWGTVFEALTHYVQPQEALKEPQQHILKVKRKSGQGSDDDDSGESDSN